MDGQARKFLRQYGYDMVLGSIAAFYVFTVPYTKVEESFNMQAMHDIIYHRHHLDKYDHLEFPGVVPRTFIGALFVSTLASPVMSILSFLSLPKFYSLIAVRLMLGCIILSTLHFFRAQIRRKFGHQVEAFFVAFTAIQFHLLFYCTRPLPNILALGLVNMSYGYLLKRSYYKALDFLIAATIIFRCDTLLLLCPICLGLLLARSISLWKAIKHCFGTVLLCVGFTILVDTIMWRRLLWPEFEVFWFNSVLNRSSEWGVHPFHWYFTSALPRSLLLVYPLFTLSLLLDRRILAYVLPVLFFIVLYSKLPHKELRFIISSVPIFNFAAAISASRIYNNRKKSFWRLLYALMLGLLLISLGCTLIFFVASYENYPSGYALKKLHQMGHSDHRAGDIMVHIDSFSAMNGITRFCENDHPWRYSKEERILPNELQNRNFTYLVNEHSRIDGFQCLFKIDGFSGVRLQKRFPLIEFVKKPKVFVHGSVSIEDVTSRNWPGCS
ncbi:dolichyl-P-Man:Man(7)GlcNAc(2)-PP-dolichol alpha-1,6-mannosyltransferase [Dionaea muscipula]